MSKALEILYMISLAFCPTMYYFGFKRGWRSGVRNERRWQYQEGGQP